MGSPQRGEDLADRPVDLLDDVAVRALLGSALPLGIARREVRADVAVGQRLPAGADVDAAEQSLRGVRGGPPQQVFEHRLLALVSHAATAAIVAKCKDLRFSGTLADEPPADAPEG